MHSIKVGTKSIISSFHYYQDGSNQAVVRYVYPKDINGDGIDEIIFAGFETQFNTPERYSNTSVHIFGWIGGKLKEITGQWLPNQTHRVQGVGDADFGDFNGDGRLDMFLSGYTDMEHPAYAYVMLNRGNYFERVQLDLVLWQHGVAVADINDDGFDDVYATGYNNPKIYFGSAQGLTPDGTYLAGGSGVALGDFLGDGRISMIVVDHDATSGLDTALYQFTFDGGQSGMKLVNALPKARLDLPKYGISSGSLGQSHDVRAEPMDFDRDGLLDVIVFSRASHSEALKTWPELSEVQFLKNLGSGQFEDVTEKILFGFKNDSNVSYNPIVRDLNGDGFDDIFMSESSWTPKHDSTFILLQTPDGKFVDTGREQLSSLVSSNGGIANIARGPGGQFFMVIEEYGFSNEGLLTTVSAASVSFLSNRAPTLVIAMNDVIVNEGQKFIWTMPKSAFKDPDTKDVLSFSLIVDGAELPTWLTWNAAKRQLSGTVPHDAQGQLTIQVTAKDKEGLSVIDDWVLVIQNVSQVRGTAKADILVAGEGDDRINGLAGQDRLTGGAGKDTFVFDAKIQASNKDIITDFMPGLDRIELSGKVFNQLKATADISSFLSFQNSTLFYDPDGAGPKSAVPIVELLGVSTLMASDWVIV
jgi:Ca2+-binding RTX toxin-like protein